MSLRVEDIELVHRVVGPKHVFASPDVPELHISHRDEDTAYRSIQPVLDAMTDVKQRIAARGVV